MAGGMISPPSATNRLGRCCLALIPEPETPPEAPCLGSSHQPAPQASVPGAARLPALRLRVVAGLVPARPAAGRPAAHGQVTAAGLGQGRVAVAR